MAFWQRRVLLDRETVTPDSTTRRLELPKTDFLSALEVRYRADNATARNPNTIVGAVSRVEVIADGAKVLFSMRGEELVRHNWFMMRQHPAWQVSEDPGDDQWVHLIVPFGRMPYDPQLALPLEAFTSVELRVTVNPVIAAGGFVTGSGQLTVAAIMYREGAPPGGHAGFLRTTEVFSFTSAGAGDRRVELPRLFPYRHIMVTALNPGVEDGVGITTVKLDLDTGTRVPIEGRWTDLQDENSRLLGINCEAEQILFVAHGDTADLYATRIQSVRAVAETGFVGVNTQLPVRQVSSVSGNRATIAGAIVYDPAATATAINDTTARRTRAKALGVSVPYAVLIPFDVGGDLSQVLNPRDFSKVELVLTQGGANADVRVILQEIVPSGQTV